MKPDWLGDQLEEFRRWIVGQPPHLSTLIVRILLTCVLSQTTSGGAFGRTLPSV